MPFVIFIYVLPNQ